MSMEKSLLKILKLSKMHLFVCSAYIIASILIIHYQQLLPQNLFRGNLKYYMCSCCVKLISIEKKSSYHSKSLIVTEDLYSFFLDEQVTSLCEAFFQFSELFSCIKIVFLWKIFWFRAGFEIRSSQLGAKGRKARRQLYDYI